MKKLISIAMLLFVFIIPKISYSQDDSLNKGTAGLMYSLKTLKNVHKELGKWIENANRACEQFLIVNIVQYNNRLTQIGRYEVELVLYSKYINNDNYSTFYDNSKGRIAAKIKTIESIKRGLATTSGYIENTYIKDHIVTIQTTCDYMIQSLMEISIGLRKN